MGQVKVGGTNYWLWVFTTVTETFLPLDRVGERRFLMSFWVRILRAMWVWWMEVLLKLHRVSTALLGAFAARGRVACGTLSRVQSSVFGVETYVCRFGWLLGLWVIGFYWRGKSFRQAAKRRLQYCLEKGYQSDAAKRFIKKVWNGFDHWFTLWLYLDWNLWAIGLSEHSGRRLFSGKSLGLLGIVRVFESTRWWHW